MKHLTVPIFVILMGITCQAQDFMKPKKIRFKEDFEHKFSNTFFPETFLEDFTLKEVFAFDRKRKNVGVTYEKIDHSSTFTVYIYPAGDGTEYRLMSEYITSMQSAANFRDNGLGALQYPVKFTGEEFICNGFKAEFEPDQGETSSLSVYECGTWFFKLRLTTRDKDSLLRENLESAILEKFDPSHLTAQQPLNAKADVRFTKDAFRDSILIGAAMGGAYKKIEWVKDNVSAKERASGFPGHYLELQMAAIKEFVAFDKKYNYKKSEYTRHYLNQLNTLIDSGYLDEHLLKSFSMVMITPEGHEVDFDGYETWKAKNEITIDINHLFHFVAFAQP